jgi:phage protein D
MSNELKVDGLNEKHGNGGKDTNIELSAIGTNNESNNYSNSKETIHDVHNVEIVANSKRTIKAATEKEEVSKSETASKKTKPNEEVAMAAEHAATASEEAFTTVLPAATIGKLDCAERSTVPANAIEEVLLEEETNSDLEEFYI